MQSPTCIWIEDWRFHRNSFLKSSTIRRRNPVESSIWRGKGFHPSTHSIPFHPSIHPIHPPILSIHPSILSVHLHIYLPSYLFTYLSTYLSTNLSSYLSFDPSIYLIIYFHTTLQSLGCMWIENSRKNNLQSKEGYRGYRQQEALRSLQTDHKAKLHRFWHLSMYHWFVPEHHLSMYWFKVSFLRGVRSRRAGKIDDAISKEEKGKHLRKLEYI